MNSRSDGQFLCTEVTKILDMREGYAPIRNILGMSDPNIVFIDGQWTMFIGGMGFGFKTNILRATLPRGATLQSNEWRFDVVPGSRWRAQKLIKQPRRGSWNRCLHSVCYVTGISGGQQVERIYTAGRKSETVLSTKIPYTIGYLEKHDGAWVSCGEPLPIQGISGNVGGVLEPKVEYVDGYWHMRYLALITPGDDKEGMHTILYTRSRDGVTDWSDPIVFSDAEENYFDSVVIPDRSTGYLMALTRDSNLLSKPDYPPQGIWLLQAEQYSGDRRDWSPPQLVVDPTKDTDGWYINGMCSPSIRWSDAPGEKNVLYAYFVSATEKSNWFALAASSVVHRRLPPPPAPFYFAIGKARIDVR